MKSPIINCIDLELSCYEGEFPPGEEQEVIEIGLTTINWKTKTIFKTYSIPIIPTKSKIGKYCTQLTGWTEKRLQRQGTTLDEAIRRLKDNYGFIGRELIVDSDKELTFLPEFLGKQTLNVSTLYSLITNDFENRSLEYMLKKVGLDFEGIPHRASVDSKNIARLFLKLLGIQDVFI